MELGSATPVQSASAAPVGLQSSPGGISDVGSTLTPPGLPLRDPPRMAGSYGVSLNVFFCWRLLGLVPGGAPFSQLSSGVRDAMVVSTKLVKCHFVTKTCIKAI